MHRFKALLSSRGAVFTAISPKIVHRRHESLIFTSHNMTTVVFTCNYCCIIGSA